MVFQTQRYEERLIFIGLDSLEHRRRRGDLIQYFKIVSGRYIINWISEITHVSLSDVPVSNLRGDKPRICRQLVRNCDPRDNFFSNRVVPDWNRLPNEVVNAATVNDFKNGLDRFFGKGVASITIPD